MTIDFGDGLTTTERVARGARWLDRTRPNWINEIDLDTLDLGACSRCVLGQIVTMERDRHEGQQFFETMEEGVQCGASVDNLMGYDDLISDEFNAAHVKMLEAVDSLSDIVLSLDDAKNLGFHLNTMGNPERDWQNLTDEWRDVIVARRSKEHGNATQ